MFNSQILFTLVSIYAHILVEIYVPKSILRKYGWVLSKVATYKKFNFKIFLFFAIIVEFMDIVLWNVLFCILIFANKKIHLKILKEKIQLIHKFLLW
ncbi:hypothetical protein IEQ34_002905 [Dendrobium chrysotoxum]|uniref:Uncharacterized protein n=1 Tax=Dendrobium chrysotoxum TaxID=161865 RepID=A0AAV7HHU8_DENCH|nr:hypothetical protein IEQ34_002905 [Dendrobium chrysotoxum]